MNEWLAQNWEVIAGIVAAIYAVAKVITNLTPSDDDNQLLAKVVKWVDYLVDFLLPNLKKGGGVHTKNLFMKKKK